MIRTDNSKEFSSAFIIPHFAEIYDQEKSRKDYLSETIEGLFSQTDEDWCAIIVVDMPPKEETRDYLNHLKQKILPQN